MTAMLGANLFYAVGVFGAVRDGRVDFHNPDLKPFQLAFAFIQQGGFSCADKYSYVTFGNKGLQFGIRAPLTLPY